MESSRWRWFGAAPTRFDAAALEALSTEYLRTRELDEVADELRVLGLPGELAKPFWETVRTSVTKRSDLADWWRICREGAEPEIAEEDIDFVRDALARLPQKPWTESTWGEWTDQVKAVSGRRGRALFLPLRKTLTGRDHGPSMSDLMPLLRAPKVSEQETTAQRGD
jgi:glutamyl-tRNA synthetase